MDLEEFNKKENILKDIALEMIQMQKGLAQLTQEHVDLFKELKNSSRMLGIKCIDGNFVIQQD